MNLFTLFKCPTKFTVGAKKLLYSAFGASLLFSLQKSNAQSISLTGMATAYTQDFNTLSNVVGSTTNNLTIPGWFMTESGGGTRDNEQYAVDAGASTTGDTYSYGSSGSTDRALGELRSGVVISIFGSSFTNNTGATIGSLDIAFVGEEWRLGTAGRADQLNFEYSLDATDLVTGTWNSVSTLSFVTPDQATTGSKNGNSSSERTALSATISSLSIANGVTFWIRWTDVDAAGADDGLAIDDFTLTPQSAASPEIDLLGNGVSIVSGDNTPSVLDSTDFGDLTVCKGTIVHTYTVSNLGTAQLNLSGTPAVSISGTNASDFIVIAQPSAIAIATNSTAVFSIEFNPSAPGLRTALVTIPNNDSDENPYTFAIQGNGTGVDLVASVSKTNISCNGLVDGSATVTATGNGTLIYDWMPGTPTGDGTTSVSALSAGGYTVSVTDANACVVSQLFSIVEPAAISATVTTVDALCNGGTGSATVTAAGGTGALSYTWSPSGGNAATATLSAGNYSYTVTDVNNCLLTQTLTINEPSAVSASVTSGTILCNGGSTTVTVSATGGTPTYNGTGTYTTTAGTYTFVATDNNSCVATATITIAEPTILSASVSVTLIACNGGNTTLTVTASGGTPGYSGTGTFTVSANSYTYTVTDANSCLATAAITVSEPSVVIPSVSASSILCNGGSATLTVSASGGTPSYTGIGTYTVTAGSYTYTITDNNSCSATTTISVTEPAAITSSQTLTVCSGQAVVVGTNTYTSNGTYTDVLSALNGCDSTVTTNLVVNSLPVLSVTVTPSTSVCEGTPVTLNGNGANTYTWSNGVTDGVAFTPTTTVTYSLSGTDGNNCTGNTTITVTVNQLPTVTLSATSNTFCVSDGPAALTGSPAGGTYSGTGVSGNSFDPAVSGVGTFTLTYTYTDGNSCTASATTVVDVNGCTGFADIQNASELIAYPNPFSSVIHLKLIGMKEATLTIYNLMGEVIFEGNTQQSNTAAIDLSAHQAGVYYVQVKSAGKSFTKKIIKE